MIAYAEKHKTGPGEVGSRGTPECPRWEPTVDDPNDTRRRDSSDENEGEAVPPPSSVATVRERFNKLAEVWQQKCAVLSSSTEKAMHPAYQQIIGMGPSALPLIFRRLQESPGHWFWALKAVTGEDPVPPEHAGRVPEMARWWLSWAEERGYLRSEVQRRTVS